MTNARLRLHQLACEAALLIVTSPNPAVAFAKFSDDVLDEIIAGHENLAGSEGLREAFRDAIGYSTRMPDEVPVVAPGQLRVIDGGEA